MSEVSPDLIEPSALPIPKIEFGLIKAHAWAALSMVFIAVAFGVLVSLKFHWPDFLGGQDWLTWGRLRYNHTQGIFFGWLGNAFLMFLYYAVPMLSMRPVVSERLGWLLFVLWNFAVVLPGWVLVLFGFSQPLEWGEFPLIVDAFVVIAFALSAVQFALPLLKTKLSALYVSAWYIIGALIFTSLAYPVGNIVPQLLPGAQGAAFSGLWIHDAIGLYVTPLAVAIAFFVVPIATNRPIYSHFLSMLGFWLLFFVYPLNGTHHYVFSAIPMDAQKAAIVASVFLGMDVVLVVTNLLMSLKGCGDYLKKDVSLRFVWMGTILYLIVSLQGSMQALLPVNKLTHFSDWVIGHSHLAMLGFATFTVIGGMAHVWQRIPNARFNNRMLSHAYWFLLVGLSLMVSSLTVAGLVEAKLWESALPWLDSVRSAKHYWYMRSAAAIPILSGFLCLALAFCTGKKNEINTSTLATIGGSREAVLNAESEELTKQPTLAVSVVPRGINMAYCAASLAGFGFFFLSFALLGIIPGMLLQSEVVRTKPAATFEPTEQEQRGRLVYAREGCAYCHTQQVRSVSSDVDRFGAPTKAWESIYDYPHLWGTRRVGPDLARESGVRSDDWQLTHLYNPRAVVPDSVMPDFPWLFAGSPVKPTSEAQDLLAYVKSLGRARQLAGTDPIQWSLSPNCECPEDVQKIETTPVALNVNAAWRKNDPTRVPFLMPTDSVEAGHLHKRGEKLFQKNCLGCHGETGDGEGPAAEGLMPRPANLTEAKMSLSHINSIILNGVPGTSMPAWRDLPPKDVQALVVYVSSFPEEDNDDYPVVAESIDHTDARKIFAEKCVSCHGTQGEGNGPAAAALERPPTNFAELQPSFEDALDVLEVGVPGTSMPPWKEQISKEDRKKLARYVRSFFRDEPKKVSSKISPQTGVK